MPGPHRIEIWPATGQIWPRNAQRGINLTLMDCLQCSNSRSDPIEIDLKWSQECFLVPLLAKIISNLEEIFSSKGQNELLRIEMTFNCSSASQKIPEIWLRI